MIVCENEFKVEDSDNPGYALCEVDFYAWIPQSNEVPNHRLSLRKNLKTDEYELYRHYVQQIMLGFSNLQMVTNQHADVEDEVIFKSKDLQSVLDRGKEEWDKFHLCWAKKPHDRDLVCTHEHPTKSLLCDVMKGVEAERTD